MVIEFAVNRCGEYRHIRMRLIQRIDALGATQQAHELDGSRLALLDPCHCGNGGIAGGQHRIHHNDVAHNKWA